MDYSENYYKLTQKLKLALLEEKEQHEFNSDILAYIRLIEEERIYKNNTEKDLTIYGRIPSELQMEYEEFNDKFMDIIYENYKEKNIKEVIDHIYDVKIGISNGSKFPSLSLANFELSKTSLNHKKDEILYIDIWATWCEFCQAPMQKVVDFAKENVDYTKSNNIRIIGISCDEKTDAWKNHVNNKNWNNIENYNLKNIREIFGIKMIPCIVVVNKTGIVDFIGHPKNYDTKIGLSRLIENKSLNNDSDEFSTLEKDAKLEISSNLIKILLENKLNSVNFVIISKREVEVETLKALSSSSKLVFYGEVKEFEEKECKNLESSLKKVSKINKIDYDFKVEKFQIDEDF